MRRGVYRLVHCPAGDHENLTVVWLGSEQEAGFSRQTALALHGISDALPAQVRLTLPETWRRRRLRVPAGVLPHYSGGAKSERRWSGTVPATAPLPTLEDCARSACRP
jgi:predicted transcriptional regulator of viral defense system